jgi:hypothetical protein
MSPSYLAEIVTPYILSRELRASEVLIPVLWPSLKLNKICMVEDFFFLA